MCSLCLFTSFISLFTTNCKGWLNRGVILRCFSLPLQNFAAVNMQFYCITLPCRYFYKVTKMWQPTNAHTTPVTLNLWLVCGLTTQTILSQVHTVSGCDLVRRACNERSAFCRLPDLLLLHSCHSLLCYLIFCFLPNLFFSSVRGLV